jgi:hypothetical protein
VDEWDGNWLNVSAHYAAHGAGVAVSGSILDTLSFAIFEGQLRKLHESLAGQAVLESVEPELKARIDGGGASGRMQLRVDMTPDHLAQDTGLSRRSTSHICRLQWRPAQRS